MKKNKILLQYIYLQKTTTFQNILFTEIRMFKAYETIEKSFSKHYALLKRLMDQAIDLNGNNFGG